MVRKIKYIILFIIIILFFGIESKAVKLDSDFETNNLFDGFSAIIGNENLSSDLIYKIRYSVKDLTDEVIDGEINYKYKISGDSKFNGYLNVSYKIEESLGKEIKASVGDILIYDLILDEYASIKKSEVFDFTEYSNNILYVSDYTYNLTFVSKDYKGIVEGLSEEIKLDFLLGIRAKKGKTSSLFLSNIDIKGIEELYSKIEEQYKSTLNHIVLYSDYYTNSSTLDAKNYNIKFLTLDTSNELNIDNVYISIIENENYFYCDDINVNAAEALSDELIYKYYVHFYDKSKVDSYKIDTDYKYSANKKGTYYYTVTLHVGEQVITSKAKIIVSNYYKPVLIVNSILEGDGSYVPINELFEYKAYSNNTDITAKVKIKDLDDYEHNYNKTGTYKFLFEVTDNITLVSKIAKLNVVKKIVDDDLNEDPNIDEISNDNNEVIDNKDDTINDDNNESIDNKEDTINDDNNEVIDSKEDTINDDNNEVIDNKEDIINDNNEVIDNKEDIINDDNNDSNEKEEIANNESLEELDIKYDLYTDNETPLTREMIRQKLIFSGFYNENDSLSISSNYFENKDKNGTYVIIVKKDDITDYYSITVKDKTNKEELEVGQENDFDYRGIIIGSIIGIVIISGIIFLIIKKVKKSK